MKSHQESPIEVAHQAGERSRIRFKALAGSTDRKIDCELKWDANSKDPAVIATQKEVTAARARQFGAASLAKRADKTAQKKRRKTDQIDEVLSWPEIMDNFPSLLELTMADRPQDSQGCP